MEGGNRAARHDSSPIGGFSTSFPALQHSPPHLDQPSLWSATSRRIRVSSAPQTALHGDLRVRSAGDRRDELTGVVRYADVVDAEE
jgi:hypothetical protein